MGCCISCLLCQSVSCCAAGVCKCCGNAVSASHIGGRIGYTVNFLSMSILAFVFRTWGQQLVEKIPVGFNVCADATCYGVSAIYRISFCLALFHVLHALIMIGVQKKGDARMGFQDGWWLVKSLVLIAAIIGSFFVPNQYISWFGWVALIGSGFFLVAQLLYFVDFAHSWAENWIRKMQGEEDNEGCKVWWWALLGSTGFLILISLVLSILMYIFFASDASDCSLNVVLITLNILFAVFILALSIHPKIQDSNPSSSLLQPALVGAYCSYLMWSAMMSGDDATCNPFYDASLVSTASNISLIMGAAFTILGLVYSTLRAAHSVSIEAAPLKQEVNEDADHSEHKDDDCKDEAIGYNVTIFHIFFALGALYLAMMLSDYNLVTPQGTSYTAIDFGQGAFWVKTISAWVVLLLFVWTLAAPALFPDREFFTHATSDV